MSGFHSTSVVISKKRIVSRGFCIVYPVCLSHRVFAFSLFCLKNVSLVCVSVLDLSHWSGRVCLRLSIAWLLFSANLSTQFSFPLCQAVPVTCKSRRGLDTGNAGYLLGTSQESFSRRNSSMASSCKGAARSFQRFTALEPVSTPHLVNELVQLGRNHLVRCPSPQIPLKQRGQSPICPVSAEEK